MTTTQSRGILRAYANATDPNAMMAQLQTAFAGFRDRHQGDVQELRAAVDEVNARLATGHGIAAPGGIITKPEDRQHADAFASWLRAPTDRGATSDLLNAEAAARAHRPQASGNTLSGAAGGYSVPEPVAGRIQERVLEISPLRRLAANFNVSSTGTRFLVNRNNAGSLWVGETDPRDDTTEPTIDLRAPSYGTVFGLVEATEELLLDSAVDGRDGALGQRAVIFAHRALRGFPALQGAGIEAKLGAGGVLTRPGSHGLLDEGNDFLAIRGWGHSSPTSLGPQIASAFFLSTINAAASASAFSLRASSRCSSMILRCASFVSRAICREAARSQSLARSQASRQTRICSG